MSSPFGVDHVPLVKSDDRKLIRQHGLRGAPQGVDRGTRQEIWEARSKHLNRKRNRWDKSSKGTKAVEVGAGTVAAGVGATVGAHQLRESMTPQGKAKFAGKVRSAQIDAARVGPRTGAAAARAGHAMIHGKPGFKLLATGGAAAATAAGARKARIYSDKKRRKYSSASGGIASGTARRMKDYDLTKRLLDEPGSLMHQADIAKFYVEERPATRAEVAKGQLIKGLVAPNQESIKSHKKAQGALGTTAAVTGLAAAATKGGAKLLPKITRGGKQGAAYARHLDRSADALLYGGSAIGGASGIHQAQIMGAEGKARQPAVAPPKKKQKVLSKRGKRMARYVGNIAEEAATRASKPVNATVDRAAKQIDDSVNNAGKQIKRSLIPVAAVGGITAGGTAAGGAYLGSRAANKKKSK